MTAISFTICSECLNQVEKDLFEILGEIEMKKIVGCICSRCNQQKTKNCFYIKVEAKFSKLKEFFEEKF